MDRRAARAGVPAVWCVLDTRVTANDLAEKFAQITIVAHYGKISISTAVGHGVHTRQANNAPFALLITDADTQGVVHEAA